MCLWVGKIHMEKCVAVFPKELQATRLQGHQTGTSRAKDAASPRSGRGRRSSVHG